jgi:uncharacterized protein YijF (DUF1287 family)
LTIFVNACFITSACGDEAIAKVIENCRKQTRLTRHYDPAYVSLDYPMGDVEISRGVCTDVVVRAFRAAGVDLQKEIHEDMKENFLEYPNNWGLKKPDKNIDHRRVPNIAAYMTRRGKSLKISKDEADYQPGDVVTWKIPGNLNHTGIISDVPVPGTTRYKVYHNIGRGVILNDILFEFKITGHFRFF